MGWLMQVLSVRGAQESASGSSCVLRRHTAETDSTDTAFQGHTTPEFCFTWCARPNRGLRAGPAPPHRNRAYGHETSPQRGRLLAREVPRPTAASARRSEDDSAAAVVGSDRTLTLNVEMASSKVKSWEARNRFVAHCSSFASIAIVPNPVPCGGHVCGQPFSSQVRHAGKKSPT